MAFKTGSINISFSRNYIYKKKMHSFIYIILDNYIMLPWSWYVNYKVTFIVTLNIREMIFAVTQFLYCSSNLFIFNCSFIVHPSWKKIRLSHWEKYVWPKKKKKKWETWQCIVSQYVALLIGDVPLKALLSLIGPLFFRWSGSTKLIFIFPGSK